MIKTKKLKTYLKFIFKNKIFLLVFIVFLVHLFLRFYQIDIRSPFGYDQVDNAWAAMNIIVNHKFPLLGFQAKGNSGIYIGPIYYYFISIFYFVTNLNPIASGIAAGVTSIFTFLTLFYIIKKLFSINVALISVFIYTVGFSGIMFDRIQGPINFIPSISLIIFYSLYKIITGKPKYLLLLGLALGFSFHVHLSSIYYLIIILLSLPFFPKTKETIVNAVVSFFVFMLFLTPNIIVFLQNAGHVSQSLGYGQTTYHGFHLRRVLQLFNDALIQFEPILAFPMLKPLKFFLIPLFIFVYLFKSISKEKLLFCYLVILYFLVPWLVLSTYNGEISDYYFSTNRFIALMILSYLVYLVWSIRHKIAKIFVIVFLFVYCIFNLINYFSYKDIGISARENSVMSAIKEERKVEFVQGFPDSYFYYYLMRQKGINVY